MGIRITQVDAFTDRPFTGNPAAVTILSDIPSDSWMQDVAREMNLSETAFLLPHDDGFDLRWFTPTAEVDLCGHATLASAHVLWTEGHLSPGTPARFYTRSGLLTARQDGNWIELDFPLLPARECPVPDHLVEALGVVPRWVGASQSDLLVLVDNEKQVRSLTPDFSLLRRIDVRGVIVTAEAVSGGSDFVSRFFAPRVGIDEDPVTGSAHCTLAPFWEERLGRMGLIGYQVSARGGKVRTRVRGDRAILAGQAVSVMQAELL
ncbi:MAG TPA: PhzF family phenazine biosynthesis protein [Longimicrobiaceae bacterium]